MTKDEKICEKSKLSRYMKRVTDNECDDTDDELS